MPLVPRASRECKALRGSALKPPALKGGATLNPLRPSAEIFVIHNLRESQAGRVQAGCCFRLGRPTMFDAETTALLRAVLEDVCESVSCYQTAARTHVASMILEAASKGETSVDGLKQIGRSALRGAPIVWN